MFVGVAVIMSCALLRRREERSEACGVMSCITMSAHNPGLFNIVRSISRWRKGRHGGLGSYEARVRRCHMVYKSLLKHKVLNVYSRFHLSHTGNRLRRKSNMWQASGESGAVANTQRCTRTYTSSSAAPQLFTHNHSRARSDSSQGCLWMFLKESSLKLYIKKV